MHNSTDDFLEQADRIIAESGVAGFSGLGHSTKRVPALIEAWGELTEDHALAVQAHVESEKVLGVKTPDIKSIRNTHHRLAQLLAVGVDETVAAKLCNYSINRVSVLKSDPAFAELLAYYGKNVEEQWGDFVGTAANLSMDVLQEMQRRLDETPEAFSVNQLNEMLKTLADRSGNAPVQKSQSVNVNIDMGTKLRESRERAAAAERLQRIAPNGG